MNLAKYTRRYKSCFYMGAAKILREHLGLPPSTAIPFSLAHGVDMGHCDRAIDVEGPEPIHWAYNQDILARSSPIKPCITLPHPWLLLADPSEPRGKGTLVIGPPPGPVNDERLAKSLERAGVKDFDVLVKARGDAVRSSAYWKSRGKNTVTAGVIEDQAFYEKLRRIFHRYERVIGCTLSSALFFASAVGLRCDVVLDYSYFAYETDDYRARVQFKGALGRDFVRHMVDGNVAETRELARTTLGEGYLAPAVTLRAQVEEAVRTLRSPVYVPRGGPLERRVRMVVAQRTGRAAALDRSVRDFLRPRPRTASLVEVNEIDIWRNGIDATNLFCEPLRFRAGITEPGFGVS